MTQLEFAAAQMEHIRSRTMKMLQAVDAELWYTIPEGIDSSIAWQAGHLIISQYFNGIACVTGPDKSLKELFPIRDYATMYGISSDPKAEFDLRPSKEEFLQQLEGLQTHLLQLWSSLDDAILTEPSVLPHPAYKTKGECLNWTALHETWHLGQIAMIRRGLGKPLTF